MKKTLCAALLVGIVGAAASAQTTEPAMIKGLNGFSVKPLLTVGEFVTNIDGGDPYQVTGIPDGIGAAALDDQGIVRLLVTHEFSQGSGAPYALANGAVFPSGARVSIFDLDIGSMEIVAGGLGYTSVVMDGGVEIDPSNVDQYVADYAIMDRFCSASLAGPEQGFYDNVFFTGEETDGGRGWAINVAARRLYEVPAFGNGAWENLVAVPSTDDNGLDGLSVIVLSDDSVGRPLYIYVGKKGDGSEGFLERNGFTGGQIYAWVADSGANTNTEFFGTGNSLSGSFVPLTSNNPSSDITGDGLLNGQDDVQNMDNMVAEAGALGAFFFSRPEDVAINPVDTDGDPTTSEIIFASTGRVTNLGDIDGDGADDEINDPWGTTYVITLDNDSIVGDGPIRADITIVYDGNDSGKQDFGIRSPDNLDWAGDGLAYIQEDRSIGGFGQTSGIEASIWQLSAATFNAIRVGVIDRSAVPSGQVDTSPDDVGNWESSGILDITGLLTDEDDAERVFVLDAQAHSVRGGAIDEDNLVQGGQILLMFGNDCPADYNRDDVVDTRDVLDFLNDWAAGDGDVSGDGLTDSRDVILFLNIWNTDC